MNIAIMAGGTGGHIFPGLAVASELKKRGVKVIWIGAKGGMEEILVKNAGLPIYLLEIKGIRGKSFFGLIKLPFRLFKATSTAASIFKKEKINSVLSLGGYAAGPGGLAAKWKKVPLVVHEQNSLFGMTNKYLSKWASAILTGFNLNQHLNSRHVGNPVRQDIEEIDKQYNSPNTKPLNILIIGGSLGSQSMNQNLPKIFNKLSKKHEFTIQHQTGKDNKDSTIERYKNISKVEVSEFITDMAHAYKNADLVIARAGALTVAEINAVGVASILIPYPYAVDDHQTTNAQHLVGNNAALTWQESEELDVLESKIDDLLSNKEKLKTMGRNSRLLHMPKAAKTVANVCMEVAR